jgi:hypothetical protein
MSQSVEEFWDDVRTARKEIAASVSKQKEQPHDVTYNRAGEVSGGTAWIISKKDRGTGMLAGTVSLANIMLAGQRLAENTHDLASDEQILAYKASEAGRKLEMDRANTARKNQYVGEAK